MVTVFFRFSFFFFFPHLLGCQAFSSRSLGFELRVKVVMGSPVLRKSRCDQRDIMSCARTREEACDPQLIVRLSASRLTQRLEVRNLCTTVRRLGCQTIRTVLFLSFFFFFFLFVFFFFSFLSLSFSFLLFSPFFFRFVCAGAFFF